MPIEDQSTSKGLPGGGRASFVLHLPVRKAFVINDQKARSTARKSQRAGNKLANDETSNLGVIHKMKKTLIVTALAFALAPVAAFATPTPAQLASKDCAALRAKIGVTPFAQAFGSVGTSNAFGKCVSKLAQLER